MNEKTQIIILAAGKGTRMGGDIPKALTPLKGKPMLSYVYDAAFQFNKKKPIVVVGYKAEMLKKEMGDLCIYVLQEEQNGTGHAVMTAETLLSSEKEDTLIILFADMPYVSSSTLERLAKTKKEKKAAIVIATSVIKNDELFHKQFYSFGRIIRDKEGNITKIVEKKEASKEELKVREVNPAFFCLDTKWMLDRLHCIENNNASGEYYLTDLVKMAFQENIPIFSVQIDEKEALGANTPEQLSLLEKYFD